MKNPFIKVEINNNTVKNFSYKRNGITLNFSLNIDTKQDLKDFLELLKVAITDVNKEIEKHGNS